MCHYVLLRSPDWPPRAAIYRATWKPFPTVVDTQTGALPAEGFYYLKFKTRAEAEHQWRIYGHTRDAPFHALNQDEKLKASVGEALWECGR